MFFFFFFQAEDGIRDLTVTGVQTCALPISEGRERVHHLGEPARVDGPRGDPGDPAGAAPDGAARRRPFRHERPDRKSTRLNSSHSQISYAVFCLKKKKKK